MWPCRTILNAGDLTETGQVWGLMGQPHTLSAVGYTFPVMRQEDSGDYGIGHSESKPTMTPTSVPQKHTSHLKILCKSTKIE